MWVVSQEKQVNLSVTHRVLSQKRKEKWMRRNGNSKI